jgi:hypothetical protein
MKIIPPQLRVALIVILAFNTSFWTFAQTEFFEPTITLSKENDAEVKKLIKSYKTFEFDVKELKKLLRKKKGIESPSEFTINLNGEKTKFTVFENDILDDNFVEYQDGKIVKYKGEISTYAGYVNDHPKNILRLYVTDNRFSGFFETEQGIFNIGHLADCGVSEKQKNINKAQIYIAKTDDIYSNLGTGICGIESSVKNGRTATRTAACTSANQMNCKYIRLAIEVDDEFKANFAKPQVNTNSSGVQVQVSATVTDAVMDMVNRANAPYLNYLGISLKLITIGSYPNGPDPYTATATTNPNVFQEFSNSNFVTSNPTSKDVCHLLTGRPLGGNAGAGYFYGQATAGGGSLCNPLSGIAKPVSISTISCGSNCIQSTNNTPNPTFLKYLDAYLTMAHEIAHVLGADHDPIQGSNTIMSGGEGKTAVFTTANKTEILNYYCNKTCVNSNNITSAYTNRLSLRLNGNPINSTPVFINNNTKVVVIPPDNNSYIPLVSSNFSYSNPNVFVFYKTLNNTSFALGSVSSFTLNVSAFDGCLNYYWGVPFVYSAAGARLANAYPNPTDDELMVESSEETPFNENEVEQIKIFEENSQEQVADFKFSDSKIQINTKNLKAGLKYLKIHLKNGEIITKRILVSHE